MDRELKNVVVLQLIFIILGVLLFIIVYTNITNYFPICYFKAHFNTICPMCGATRFFINIARFNFIEAFLYHPFLFILASYILIFDFVYVFNSIYKKNYGLFLYPSTKILVVFLSLFIIQYFTKIVLINYGVQSIYLI